MKGLFKLTTAALALVAFASCSNDDFFGSNEAQKKDFTSILEVEVEEPDFGEVTRAARKGDATGFKWQADDQIRVYDTDLGKYDVYEYADAFGREGATVLEKAPAYALFPAENVKRGYWDPTDGHVAEIVIPKVITYSKTNGAETKLDDGTVLYKMFTPMQGKVEKVDDATVRVLEPGMQVMTGVLYMTLNQALGNAAYIKLSSATNLSGRFLAKLDEENATLIESTDELIAASYSKDLYIDLRNLPSDKAVLYVPVIAGVNDLKVYRTTDTAADPTTIAAGNWTLITNLDTYTFQRNRFKSVEYTYTLAANTPSGINTALAQYNEQSTPVTLDVTKSLTIADDDKTIKIPAMATDKVTINLKNSSAVTNATPSTLTIQDANASKPFTGTLVLNVTDKLTDGSKLPLDINLPKAKVVLVGDYTQTTVAPLTLTAVDELQFGDASTTTKFSGATLTLTGVATKITVENLATVSASTSLTAANADLEVKNSGAINGGGNVSIASATISGSVSADLVLSGDLTINNSGYVNGNITTKGNVTIARSSDNVAIAADKSLTFTRAKTLTMKRGYIGTVTNDFSTLGEADGHTVNIVFEENGLTAIKAVTPVTSGAGQWEDAKILLAKSTWTGAEPNSTVISPFIDSYNIYTAAQLVSLRNSTGATINLQNDIDLNNDPNNKWTYPISNTAGAVAITGNKHTISNIKLNNLKYDATGIGFIGSATTLNVTDLTLDNVQFTKGYTTHQTAANNYKIAAVGGLCGTASGAITLSNVTVNLADNFGYSSYTVGGNGTVAVEVNAANVGVGGLIGIAGSEDADLNNVDVTGAKIQGYTSLGGFIGVTTGAIDIDRNCSSNITEFQVNYNDPTAVNIEMNLARVGGFVGYQAGTSKNITIDRRSSVAEVSITGAAYDTNKLYVSVAGVSGAKLYSYAKNQNWVGYCGTDANPAAYTGNVFDKPASGATITYKSRTFDSNGNLVNLGTNQQGLYTWTAKAN